MVIEKRYSFHEKEKKMRELVEKALAKVRPMLERDGGSVELVEIEGTVVKVRLTGACHGCPMSQMTLKAGVERIVKQDVPQVTEVVAI
jgi:Fe-S cluster biogenesis protein NfuA